MKIYKTFVDKASKSILIVNNDKRLLPTGIQKQKYFDGEWFYIYKLFVSKKYRNKGIATKLINKMIKWATKNKYNLVLEVTPYDKSMSYNNLIGFYEKFGFIYKNGYMIKKYLC